MLIKSIINHFSLPSFHHILAICSIGRFCDSLFALEVGFGLSNKKMFVGLTIVAFIAGIIRHRRHRDENTKTIRKRDPAHKRKQTTRTEVNIFVSDITWWQSDGMRETIETMFMSQPTDTNLRLAFVFLFTAFAPSTSKSSGTSAVYCSFPPSIRIWLKFAWICGFRYHFTLNKPAGIESIQTHPKTARENFPFGKSPKKKTLGLTLKYILVRASFCLCATMEDNAKVTRALITLYLVQRGSIEGKLLISYPNNWLSRLLTHEFHKRLCFSTDSASLRNRLHFDPQFKSFQRTDIFNFFRMNTRNSSLRFVPHKFWL